MVKKIIIEKQLRKKDSNLYHRLFSEKFILDLDP